MIALLFGWICPECQTGNLDFMPTCRVCDPGWGKR